MDELEPGLRAELGRLAGGPAPSDALVGRTFARSIQIRRRRNAVAASSVAAAVLAVTLVVATVAGGEPNRAQFQVTGPPDTEIPTTTSTTVPTSTTTAPIGPPVTRPRTSPATVSVSPTTSGNCPAPTQVDVTSGLIYELDPTTGNVTVVVSLPFGPGAILTPYTLDDGSRGAGGFRKTYTPAQFGVHWYENPRPDLNGQVCPSERYTFDVETPAATTTTTESTTTTVPPTTTTGPETTTSVG
ncbi:MAG TPA: hypothetical protein VGP92_08570 [Acidimicrobiia bacterium]|nr:hypothetical protein [Acidimicrobiia bacterium]